MKEKPSKPTESWLEYLEDELDPSLREDYTKLLSHSKADEKVLNDLKRLRGSIQHADTYKKTEFNQRLFDNIVSEINQTPIHSHWRLMATSPKTWGPIAASLILVIGLFSLLRTSNETPSTVVQTVSDKTDWLVQESVQNPEILAQTVNSHKTNGDLALETLAYQTEDMSDAELSQVMDNLLE